MLEKRCRARKVNSLADAVITEHAGTRHGSITRFYQYGSGGIRVLDDKKVLRRLYLFDHASSTMTENDPVRREKILRRFVFDPYGMLEETFSFGERPRTFRFEDGARRIAVREGGDYGAVGKIFTFEDNGVSETGWGRNGEIERVYIFEPGNDTIVERAGGWFGDIDRTIVFEGIDASVFREPESFLQFLMFTEWHPQEVADTIERAAAEIRRGGNAPSAVPKSRYAYTGPRHGSADMGEVRGQEPVPRMPALQRDERPARSPRGSMADAGIDFIADGDSPGQTVSRGPGTSSRPSSDIPFGERRGSRPGDGERFPAGRSADISLEERFGNARQEREKLSMGKSVEIPLEERFESSHREKEKLSMGKSVEIPIEERFESARREREKLARGKSADIPYSERRGGGDR